MGKKGWRCAQCDTDNMSFSQKCVSCQTPKGVPAATTTTMNPTTPPPPTSTTSPSAIPAASVEHRAALFEGVFGRKLGDTAQSPDRHIEAKQKETDFIPFQEARRALIDGIGDDLRRPPSMVASSSRKPTAERLSSPAKQAPPPTSSTLSTTSVKTLRDAAEIEGLNAKIGALGAKCAELTAQLEIKDEKVVQLEHRARELGLESVASRHHTAEATIQEEAVRAQRQCDRIEELEVKVATLEDQLHDSAEEDRKKYEMITILEEQLKTQKDATLALQQQIEEDSKRISSDENLTFELTRLRTNATTAEAANNSLKQANLSLTADNADLKRALEEATTSAKDLESSNTKLLKDLELLQQIVSDKKILLCEKEESVVRSSLKTDEHNESTERHSTFAKKASEVQILSLEYENQEIRRQLTLKQTDYEAAKQRFSDAETASQLALLAAESHQRGLMEFDALSIYPTLESEISCSKISLSDLQGEWLTRGTDILCVKHDQILNVNGTFVGNNTLHRCETTGYMMFEQHTATMLPLGRPNRNVIFWSDGDVWVKLFKSYHERHRDASVQTSLNGIDVQSAFIAAAESEARQGLQQNACSASLALSSTFTSTLLQGLTDAGREIREHNSLIEPFETSQATLKQLRETLEAEEAKRRTLEGIVESMSAGVSVQALEDAVQGGMVKELRAEAKASREVCALKGFFCGCV